MGVHEAMYYHLFNIVTDALRLIEQRNYGMAEETLKRGQREGEEMYLKEEQNSP